MDDKRTALSVAIGEISRAMHNGHDLKPAAKHLQDIAKHMHQTPEHVFKGAKVQEPMTPQELYQAARHFQTVAAAEQTKLDKLSYAVMKFREQAATMPEGNQFRTMIETMLQTFDDILRGKK